MNEAGTILVVEDEEFVRKVACEVLRSSGYNVLIAGNAEQACEACRQCGGRTDLLLADIILPGKDGRQLANDFKCLCPDVRILLMSGYVEQVVQCEFLSDGHEWLAKPFSAQTLLRKVRQVLDTAPSITAKSAGSSVPSVAGSLEDLIGDLGERNQPVQNSQFRADAGHAIDGTSGLVLANGQAALPIDRLDS